jgi:hypothetical protein
MHSRDDVAAEIKQLEQLTNSSLNAVPVHMVDQWGAGVRDMLSGLGVDKLDHKASRAALGGAYLVASLTLSNSVLPAANLEAVAHVLRWLYDRGEADG